ERDRLHQSIELLTLAGLRPDRAGLALQDDDLRNFCRSLPASRDAANAANSALCVGRLRQGAKSPSGDETRPMLLRLRETLKSQELVMNTNQVDGAIKEVKGAIKEGVSKVTGNPLGQVEGKIEKEVGKAQKDLGNAQERDRKESRRP